MQYPRFLEKEDVIKIHDRLISKFGGKEGIFEERGLDSALALPRQTFGGQLLHPTIFDQASAYLYHIAKNHAFNDGNKRTALAAVNAFLPMNGYRLIMPKDMAYTMVIDVVLDKLSKEEVSNLLQEYSIPYNSE